MRCRRCDLVFQERIGTPDDTQPEQHSADGGSQNRFAPWLERVIRLFRLSRVRLAIRLMPTGGRVLDIGCGRGVYLRMLRERGYQVRGTEYSAAAAPADPRRPADRRAQLRLHAGPPRR